MQDKIIKYDIVTEMLELVLNDVQELNVKINYRLQKNKVTFSIIKNLGVCRINLPYDEHYHWTNREIAWYITHLYNKEG